MEYNQDEQDVYGKTVIVYSMCIELLARKNFLRFERVDLGSYMYRSATPEKGLTGTVFPAWSDDGKMILGMVCADVRDSLVRVVDTSNLIRVNMVPMSSIAVAEWSGNLRDLWPCGWILSPRSRLQIDIEWDGKEKPGILTLVTMLLG